MDSIRVRNSERDKKKTKRMERGYFVLTPPKYNSKNSKMYKIKNFERRLGYDYDDKTESKVLKEMKQEFDQKVDKYMGKGDFMRKAGRMEKIRRKEQLDLKMERNPVVSTLEKLNKTFLNMKVADAFEVIKHNYANQ